MITRSRKGVTLQIYEGSIVDCYTDAVVIPTTATLDWDPEVGQELLKKAGPTAIARARRKIPLDIGEAVVTPSGGMLACFIVHVALPAGVQAASIETRRELFETIIRNSVLRCAELGVPSVGLPNLGRWFGFSLKDSAQLLFTALDRAILDGGSVNEIHLVLENNAEITAFADAGREDPV